MRFAVLVVVAAGCGDIFDLEPVGPVELDAPPLVCPSTYVEIVGWSHYRYVGRTAYWDEAEADCENDLPGATHLVTFDSLDEMAATRPLVTNPPPWNAFAGYARNMAVDPAVFFAVTGERIESGLPGFELWANNEPNNSGGVETITFYEDDHGMLDGEPTRHEEYVCECDGRAPTLTFTIR